LRVEQVADAADGPLEIVDGPDSFGAQGRSFCFIDKHGDSAKRIADSAAQNVIYWQPVDLSYPIGLNALQNVPPDER